MCGVGAQRESLGCARRGVGIACDLWLWGDFWGKDGEYRTRDAYNRREPETLASTRGGVIIRATAIPDLTNYMQDVLGLGSGKDVFEELDVDVFIGCFTAAEVYEDEVPAPMVSSLTKWFNDTAVPKTPTSKQNDTT